MVKNVNALLLLFMASTKIITQQSHFQHNKNKCFLSSKSASHHMNTFSNKCQKVILNDTNIFFNVTF